MPATMDTTDDVTYLNYLREKSNSFLLQSGDVALGVQDPTLNCETIFEEFDSGTHAWTIDGLPVLLDGSVITEADDSGAQINLETRKIVVQDEISPMDHIDNNEGFITSNGLFLPNDVLLQFNLQSDIQENEDNSHVINADNNEMEIFVNSDNQVYEVNFKKKDHNPQPSKKLNDATIITENIDINTNGEMIQLLNADGSIINIDKEFLTAKQDSSKEINIDFGEQVETVTAYKCKTCSYLTESINVMSDHVVNKTCARESRSILNSNPLKNKLQQMILLCSECNKGYMNTEDLKQHMMLQHELVGQNCTPINKEVINKDNTPEQRILEYVNIIKSQHKASKKVKCSIKGCEIRFALEDYRIRHEQCHVDGNKKQFRCPTCDKRFSIWRVCSLHLWKCHDVDAGLLNCVSCNFKAFSAHKLLNHMLIHKEQKQFLCNECGKSFKQITQLRNHQVLHLNHTQGAPNWSLPKRCDICDKCFSDAKGLKKHVQSVHNNFKPYVCNICGHKSSRKAMLELHLRQHTGEKPYSCQICSYKTGDHNSLRRHLMRHDGTKKYSCPHCDYQAIQSVAFKQHIANKHPGKEGVYFCSRCSFQTISQSSLENHEKLHEEQLAKTSQTKIDVDPMCLVEIEEKKSDDQNVPPKKNSKIEEDDETQHGFLTSIHNDETVDTGGITIPADLELHV